MEKVKAFWNAGTMQKVVVVAGVIGVGVGIYFGVKKLMKK